MSRSVRRESASVSSARVNRRTNGYRSGGSPRARGAQRSRRGVPSASAYSYGYVDAASRARKSSKSRAVSNALALLVLAALVAAAFFAVPYVSRVVSGEVKLLNFGAIELAPYSSPYDWEQLSWEGEGADRAVLYQDGAPISDVGIDVSEFNGSIDWDAVAADGISFAFVRVGARGYTEGGLSPDARYAQNLDEAAAAGLQVGAYFFSQAISPEEALVEAEYMIELLEGRSLSLPVVFDHERVAETSGRANHMTGDEVTECARVFCERIEEAGYETMLYGNAWDMHRLGYGEDSSGGVDVMGGRSVWLAEYDVRPTADFHFEYWQYSSNGGVAGIPTRVDMNLRLLA